MCTDHDNDGFLNMMGHLWKWGNKFNCFPDQYVLNFLSKERFTGTCGKISQAVISLAQSFGINARKISVFTRDEWNGQDDRHHMVEIQNGEEWRVFDPTTNMSFFSFLNENAASILDVMDQGIDSIIIQKLPGQILPGEFEVLTEDGVFNYAGHAYFTTCGNTEVLKEWHKHIIQVPVLYNKDGKAFYLETVCTNSDIMNQVASPQSDEQFRSLRKYGI